MFAVAAIGSMMALAGEGRAEREGTRMGLWGAAQAIAAGFGGLLGAALADAMRTVMTNPSAFGTVFVLEAMLYIASAVMAVRIMDRDPTLRAGRRGCSGRMTMLLRCRRCGGVDPRVPRPPKTSRGPATRWR